MKKQLLLRRVKHIVANLTRAKPENAWFQSAVTLLLSAKGLDNDAIAALTGYHIDEVKVVQKHIRCKKDWFGKVGVSLFLLESLAASSALYHARGFDCKN